MIAEFPSLKDLVEAEIARRDEGGGLWPAFAFIVHDVADAMTDVDVAVKAIIEQADKGNCDDRVYIISAIYEAVINALRARYPRRFIYARQIAESPMHLAARPSTEVYEEEVDRAINRAAERLAKLKQPQQGAA